MSESIPLIYTSFHDYNVLLIIVVLKKVWNQVMWIHHICVFFSCKLRFLVWLDPLHFHLSLTIT